MDIHSVLFFFAGLAVTLALIFATYFFARLLRARIIWSPVGRFLYRVGFTKANGTIDDLRGGQAYIVKKGLSYPGKDLAVGERLTFKGQGYIDQLGHVLEFQERTLYLREEEHREFLQKIWLYLEPIKG